MVSIFIFLQPTTSETIITPSIKSDLMSNALQMLQSKNEPPSLKNQNAMEGLSDSDLKTLLQNFKDLSTDEQHGLITYLKKLEAREPDRVERLRKFVKLGPNIETTEKTYSSGRVSPFSNREGGQNPSVDDMDKKVKNNPPQKKLNIDSDEDDDYSFEDVFRAASKNVKQIQEEKKLLEPKVVEKPKDLGINLNDAKMLIANLMGQLGNSNKNSGLNLLGLASTAPNSTPTNTVITTSNLLNIPSTNIEPIQNTTPTVINNAKIPNINPAPPQKTEVGYPPVNQNYNYYPPNRQYPPNQFEPNYNNQGFQPGNFNQEYNYQEYNNFNPGVNPQVRPPFRPGPGQYQYDPRQNYY